MNRRYGDIDYSRATKGAFIFGAVLFVIGVLGDRYLSATAGAVPQWEATLLLDAEMLGILVMLLSPFVFGILLPLTE